MQYDSEDLTDDEVTDLVEEIEHAESHGGDLVPLDLSTAKKLLARYQETLIKTFTLFWLSGTREVVKGMDIADAFSKAGYGAGAMRALDVHVEGDSNRYTWDTNAKKWVDTPKENVNA